MKSSFPKAAEYLDNLDTATADKLDIIAKENPSMIRDTTKTGGDTGGSGGGGESEFTAEKALKDPDLYDKWMQQNSAECLAAIAAYQQTL